MNKHPGKKSFQLTNPSNTFVSVVNYAERFDGCEIMSGRATYGIKVSPDFLRALYDQILSGPDATSLTVNIMPEADLGVASIISSMISDNFGWGGELLFVS